ncbi:hypothetical protein [Spiroplasma monobiae]|uniref:Uncharacterized protein n=1 Tax=Spiroplasma monobiae MQ-1 TaxID=1336748 RepID=A0A2K9LX71_SPISQ|nr:hypothetical protein [Spiroplasma monobiae]AUM62955.1 hypothetical protein SMONO_v1c07060 [Spiroplasma monobiae MQ-1]
MIIILDISLKDEIKFSEELQDKEFIKVSQVNSNTMNLDSIFINEKYSYNKKEYYRLFVRPSLSNKGNYDYFKNFFQTSKDDETKLNFKSGAIQFYIRTKNGVEVIKSGKNDLFEFSPYSIIAKRNGQYLLSNFDFIEVDIPATYVDDQQELFISYSASYNVEGYNLKPHTNYGGIEIDRRNLTQHNHSKNRSLLTIANLAYGYINYDFNNKYKRNYFDLLRNDIEIMVESRNLNTIDPVMIIQNKYSLWNDMDISFLGKNMNDFFKLYLNGLNRTESLTSTPKIKSNSNYGDYYNIKKITDTVKQENGKFLIINSNQTSYSFSKNLVEDSEYGNDGIIWNPLYKNPITYNRTIDFNSRNLSLDYINEDVNTDIYNIEFCKNLVKDKYDHLIVYKISELNDIGWKNKERIINYINEKEKNI